MSLSGEYEGHPAPHFAGCAAPAWTGVARWSRILHAGWSWVQALGSSGYECGPALAGLAWTTGFLNRGRGTAVEKTGDGFGPSRVSLGLAGIPEESPPWSTKLEPKICRHRLSTPAIAQSAMAFGATRHALQRMSQAVSPHPRLRGDDELTKPCAP